MQRVEILTAAGKYRHFQLLQIRQKVHHVLIHFLVFHEYKIIDPPDPVDINLLN